MTGDLRYLYAVASRSADAAIAAANLRGIEGGPVETIVEGDLLGVTSVVPASDYEEAPLNERLQDLEWLAPRAASHQEVNGKLLELASAVVPLAFGAIYRDTDGIRELLRARADDFADRLRAVEGRAEWIVSIERDGSRAPAGGAARALDAEIAAAPPEDPTAAAIARFSVLTHRDREVELGDVVRRLGASGVSEGYRVRLSGPWPAYRFGGLPSERVASA